MIDRLFPFAVLAVIASILTGGLAISSAPRATTVAAAGGRSSDGPAMAGELGRAALPSRPPRTISSGRSPVPLLPARHAMYWGEGSSSPATAAGRAVTGTEEKNGPSAVEAKAMIEADGYKSVKALERTPDGAWRGRALRGTTEVAIGVDTTGRVSTQ